MSEDDLSQFAQVARRRPIRAPQRRKGGGAAWIIIVLVVLGACGGLFYLVSLRAPEPPPVPVAKPTDAPSTEPEAAPAKALAKVKKASGGVLARRGGTTVELEAGAELFDGDDLELAGFYAMAEFAFEGEATSVTLKDGARMRMTVPGGAKKLELFSGQLLCTVSDQTEGKPLTVRAINGEAIIHGGTKFGVEMSENRTRIEVTKGTVGFKSLQGEEILVTDDQFVSAGREGATRGALAPAILDLFLVEADTGKAIAAHAPLREGHVIELSKLPSPRVNVVARVSSVTGSIQWLLDGKLPPERAQSYENEEPYVLTGREPKPDEEDPPARIWRPEVGEHEIEARVFRDDHGQGGKGETLMVKFTVKN